MGDIETVKAISHAYQVSFGTPIEWYPPKLDRISFNFVKKCFVTLAEFYISYQANIAWPVPNDEIFIQKDFPVNCLTPFQIIRGFGAAGFLVGAIRVGAYIAVRVGKEQTPVLIKVLNTPLHGFVVRTFGAGIYIGAALSFILLTVKIYMRCTHHFVKDGTIIVKSDELVGGVDASE